MVEGEKAFRAAASHETSPATPAGFLRLFDMLAFNCFAANMLARAQDRRMGLAVLRRQDADKRTAYFNVAFAFAAELQGKTMSRQEIAEAINDKVHELDLRCWFKAVFTDEAPETFATHFMKFTNYKNGGASEVVGLLPDAYLSAEEVRRECEALERLGVDVRGKLHPSGQPVH